MRGRDLQAAVCRFEEDQRQAAHCQPVVVVAHEQNISDLIKFKLVQSATIGVNLLMITGQVLVSSIGDECGSGQRWRTIFWTTTFRETQ